MDIETLLARYIDGEMPDEERRAFEQRLATDAQLAARCEAWSRQDLATAVELDALLDASPWDASNVAGLGQPVDLAARRQARSADRRPRAATQRWFVPAALAASVAMVALLSVYVMQGRGDPSLDALEHLPSGQTLALEDGTGITAVLTFAAADGRWCREYARPQGGTGIACRTDGRWQVESEVGGTGHIPAEQDQGYAMVGAEDSASLDAVYASLASGEPLGQQDEARLLENGWAALTD